MGFEAVNNKNENENETLWLASFLQRADQAVKIRRLVSSSINARGLNLIKAELLCCQADAKSLRLSLEAVKHGFIQGYAAAVQQILNGDVECGELTITKPTEGEPV